VKQLFFPGVAALDLMRRRSRPPRDPAADQYPVWRPVKREDSRQLSA
jgi:hypothetical protein